MNIRQTTRTPAILSELGRRVERLRLQRNQPLAELAENAGVGTATLQRLESGRSVNVTTLIQVLRALNRLGDMDNIVSDVDVSPFELTRSRRRPRRRASGSRESGAGESGARDPASGD